MHRESSAFPLCANATPNPSLQSTCYGWLRRPPHAVELKR